MIGLFCKRALLKRLYSAKENYDFKEPTNRSHPICHTTFGLALVSRIGKIIGLFCKRALQKKQYSEKDITDRSHPIDPNHRSHPIRLPDTRKVSLTFE